MVRWPRQAIITIRVVAEFGADKAASGLEVAVPMPSQVQRVHAELPRDLRPPGAQTWDWQERARRLVWKFRRVQGGSDSSLKVRVSRFSWLWGFRV